MSDWSNTEKRLCATCGHEYTFERFGGVIPSHSRQTGELGPLGPLACPGSGVRPAPPVGATLGRVGRELGRLWHDLARAADLYPQERVRLERIAATVIEAKHQAEGSPESEVPLSLLVTASPGGGKTATLGALAVHGGLVDIVDVKAARDASGGGEGPAMGAHMRNWATVHSGHGRFRGLLSAASVLGVLVAAVVVLVGVPASVASVLGASAEGVVVAVAAFVLGGVAAFGLTSGWLRRRPRPTGNATTQMRNNATKGSESTDGLS